MNRPVTIRVQKIKKNRIRTRLLFFLFLVGVLLLVSFFADRIVPYDPYAQDLSLSRQPPSAVHWMGTDQYGRDVFSRVIAGAQASVFSTLLLVCVTSVFGTVVGTLCGYVGRGVDSVFMLLLTPSATTDTASSVVAEMFSLKSITIVPLRGA